MIQETFAYDNQLSINVMCGKKCPQSPVKHHATTSNTYLMLVIKSKLMLCYGPKAVTLPLLTSTQLCKQVF